MTLFLRKKKWYCNNSWPQIGYILNLSKRPFKQNHSSMHQNQNWTTFEKKKMNIHKTDWWINYAYFLSLPKKKKINDTGLEIGTISGEYKKVLSNWWCGPCGFQVEKICSGGVLLHKNIEWVEQGRVLCRVPGVKHLEFGKKKKTLGIEWIVGCAMQDVIGKSRRFWKDLWQWCPLCILVQICTVFHDGHCKSSPLCANIMKLWYFRMQDLSGILHLGHAWWQVTNPWGI